MPPVAHPSAALALRGQALAALWRLARGLRAPAWSLAPAALTRALRRELVGLYAALLARSRGLTEGAPLAELRGLLRSAEAHPWARLREALSLPARLSLEALDPDAQDTESLLALCLEVEGEAVDYRALPVAHLGAVYESLLGFEVRRCEGEGLALGADARFVSLEAALADPARAALFDAAKPSPAARRALLAARTTPELHAALARYRSPLTPRAHARDAGFLAPTLERRRAGAHYTPAALAERVARETLAPLLAAVPSALEVRVCDPALGAGALLCAAGEVLAEALARGGEQDLPAARRLVLERCLYGVDRDEEALEVARAALRLWSAAPGPEPSSLDAHLRAGSLLLGVARPRPEGGLDAREAFPEVFAPPRGGFDAVLGNPPWVSYAGRAAQPLEPALRRFYLAHFESFAGYRNLQSLFAEWATRHARPGGRVGLLLPSSTAELAGYAPTRAAHDRRALCDATLPDLGEDGFEGVFQPSMLLLSTVRPRPVDADGEAPWPLERPDLDAQARALLTKLEGPCLPPELFGERGLQTERADHAHLRDAPDDAHPVGLRVGSDLRPFLLGPPHQWASPAHFGPRLAREERWREVRFVLRQTARVPMAALTDGGAFRNSLLAGFGSERFSPVFLVAWLNSAPVRWFHYQRHRDARLGMPQLKIGHLRALPAPPTEALLRAVEELGARLCRDPLAVTRESLRALDALVAEGLGLTPAERERIDRDATRWGLESVNPRSP